MKPGQLAQVAFIVVASVAVYSFVRAAQGDHRLTSCSALCEMRPDYAGRNRTAPEFELPNLAGEKRKLSDYLGRGPVVLNFWTKTCKPCLEEMPMLADFARIARSRGVQTVTICTDDGPDAVKDTLKVILKGQDPPFEILFDPDAEVVTDKYGTTLFPETWVLDGKGVIRARIDGARDWTSSIALDVVDMVGRPSGCPVDFLGKKPVGQFASLCGEG